MTEIIIVSLIAFGLAYTLAKLDGPFGMAGAVRRLLQRSWLPGWVRNGAECPFCWSFYTTLLAAWLVAPDLLVVTWLAGFGLACFLFLYTGH